jgi:glycosyltransferase involved in cell wall biosynthesis
MRRRIAFIDYFPTHYRKRLYEEIARRMDADFYFFSDEAERWHNKLIPATYEGDYRRVDLRRVRVGGQAVLPGIARALTPRRYDAVVKSLNGKLMLPLTYGTARLRGVAFVLWTGMWHHPATPFHRLSRPLTEGVYRGAGAIVAYGDHVKGFLAAVRGVDPGKVFVAGQAVDPAPFEAIEPPRNGSPEVLFVGQFEERKGVRTLLDAFDLVGDAGARLRLVGNGPLEPEIRARSARSPNIEIVGHVSQERLPHELARARCLVLPSITTALDREPWGVVVNEAMHAGLPVVASSAVGAAAGGLVRDGRSGFVVPERDPVALAAALGRIVSNPSLSARLGDEARRDVAAFDYGRMADAFEMAVEHAIATRRGR